MIDTLEGQQVYITGASSGVGLCVAQEFARGGAAVAIGYGSNEKFANKALDLLNDIDNDGNFVTVGGDITDEGARGEIARFLSSWTEGRPLDHLVLNASGGLEPDRIRENPNYPTEINVYAQRDMARLFKQSGLLADVSTLTFVASHQAWYLGRTLPDSNGQAQPIGAWRAIDEGYTPVAESKSAGIDEMIGVIQPETGSRLLVASTDLILDSKVARVAAKRGGYIPAKNDPDHGHKSLRERWDVGVQILGEARRDELREIGLDDTLYSSEEFARYIVASATDTSWERRNFVLLPDHHDEMQPA